MMASCAAQPAYAEPVCVTIEKYEKGKSTKNWVSIFNDETDLSVELFSPEEEFPEKIVMVLFENGCYKQYLSREIPVELPMQAALESKMKIRINTPL